MTIQELQQLLQVTNDLARTLDQLDDLARDLDGLQERLDALIEESGA